MLRLAPGTVDYKKDLKRGTRMRLHGEYIGESFAGENFSNAELSGTFVDVDFTGANFTGAALNGTFVDSNFIDADLTDADTCEGNFVNCRTK
jgi:uncharacterized protein YjbI with pentapeptide repeats